MKIREVRINIEISQIDGYLTDGLSPINKKWYLFELQELANGFHRHYDSRLGNYMIKDSQAKRGFIVINCVLYLFQDILLMF